MKTPYVTVSAIKDSQQLLYHSDKVKEADGGCIMH